MRKIYIFVPTSCMIFWPHFHVENKLPEISAVQGCPRAFVSEGLKPVTTGIAKVCRWEFAEYCRMKEVSPSWVEVKGELFPFAWGYPL